jgi:single-stranded-DNA-specific exonuclease
MKKSILGNEWVLGEVSDSDVMHLQQKYGLSEQVARIITSKQIPHETVADFLDPKLKNLLSDPFELLDMKQAVMRLKKAIEGRENVVIFGDYDVDGACSSALIKNFLNIVGIRAEIYIPDRVLEGYGPNSAALLNLRKNGADLLITVDCGTVAFKPLEDAFHAGLDVIVIDHHIGVKEKPHSIAVVNPNRFDETTDLTYLCGAGVVFMMLVGLNKTLREADFYAQKGIKEPNLLQFLDTVALATVCDVVPLLGLNRAFVRTGLKVLESGGNKGLRALLEIGGLEKTADEYDLGFMVGPRINAGGRIGNSALGARILSSNNAEEIARLAKELDDFNIQRREIEAGIILHALERVEAERLHISEMIFLGHETYHQGVIGIVAGKLKEGYNKPVAVMEFKNGLAKASLRSVGGIDLGSVVNAANKAGLLVAGGGHAMAAGFTCEIAKLESLKAFFYEQIRLQLENNPAGNILKLEALVAFSALNNAFYSQLTLLKPFGPGNPKPIFYAQNINLISTQILKEKHLAIILKCPHSQSSVRSVVFNFQNSPLGKNLLNLQGKTLDIAFTMRFNDWSGKVELDLVDFYVI